VGRRAFDGDRSADPACAPGPACTRGALSGRTDGADAGRLSGRSGFARASVDTSVCVTLRILQAAGSNHACVGVLAQHSVRSRGRSGTGSDAAGGCDGCTGESRTGRGPIFHGPFGSQRARGWAWLAGPNPGVGGAASTRRRAAAPSRATGPRASASGSSRSTGRPQSNTVWRSDVGSQHGHLVVCGALYKAAEAAQPKPAGHPQFRLRRLVRDRDRPPHDRLNRVVRGRAGDFL
jgi:hypothetical protein